MTDAVLKILREFIIFTPAGAAAAIGYKYAAHTHWGIAAVVALAAAIVVLPFGHSAAAVIDAFFPDFAPGDRRLRRHLKSLSDTELKAEESNAITRRTGHTPKWGEERCGQCGVRSPARCGHLLAAERHLYAIRTERRHRDEHPRRMAKLATRNRMADSGSDLLDGMNGLDRFDGPPSRNALSDPEGAA